MYRKKHYDDIIDKLVETKFFKKFVSLWDMNIIFVAVVGSRIDGTNSAESDYDIGFFVDDKDYEKIPEVLRNKEFKWTPSIRYGDIEFDFVFVPVSAVYIGKTLFKGDMLVYSALVHDSMLTEKNIFYFNEKYTDFIHYYLYNEDFRLKTRLFGIYSLFDTVFFIADNSWRIEDDILGYRKITLLEKLIESNEMDYTWFLQKRLDGYNHKCATRSLEIFIGVNTLPEVFGDMTFDMDFIKKIKHRICKENLSKEEQEQYILYVKQFYDFYKEHPLDTGYLGKQLYTELRNELCKVH